MSRIPGPNEPDPENLRQRPFQGGTDNLAGPPAQGELQRGGAGSGLSGLPQADAGNVPARFNSPDTPPGDTQQ